MSIKQPSLLPMPSFFETLSEAPTDPVFGMSIQCKADPCREKVDLTVGAYRDEELSPYVFEVVNKAEAQLIKEHMSKEYLPIDGLPSLIKVSQSLVFGEDSAQAKQGRIATCQSLSGTGGLRLLGDLIRKSDRKFSDIYMSEPTWANHVNIFKSCGYEVRRYFYWDKDTKCLNIERMLHEFKCIPKPSVILFHASGHNPTGLDPTHEEWKQIIDFFAQTQHILVFDMAYQGFVTGSLDEDAYPIRLALSKDIEFAVCQSYAKNLGLYAERIGMAHLVCRTSQIAKAAVSHLKVIVRSQYSSPPKWGSNVASMILNDPNLYQEWIKELSSVSHRLQHCRTMLYEGLVEKKTPGSWDHIARQKGMFTYTGLSELQCKYIIKKWSVYLLLNGRISLAGINAKNCQRVVDAIHDAVTTNPEMLASKL